MTTRRGFLIATATSSIAAAVTQIRKESTPSAVPQRSNVQFNAPTGQPKSASLLPAEANTFEIISRDFTSRTRIPVVLSQEMKVAEQEQLSVEITFDSRLFAGGGEVLLFNGRTFKSAATSVSKPDRTGAAKLTYYIPQFSDSAGGETITLQLPLSTTYAYPDDAIDSPIPLQLRILDGSGTEVARQDWAPTPFGDPVSAWGLELSAAWESCDVKAADSGDNSRYRYPVTIVCTSVGPEPTPVGSTICIDLDVMSRDVVSATRP